MICETATGAGVARRQDQAHASPLVENDDQSASRPERRDERLTRAFRSSPAGRRVFGGRASRGLEGKGE